MSTAGLIDGSLTPGIYRVLEPVSTISAALTEAGWDSPVVPPTVTTGQFYRGLADAMGWPGYFGANLDALSDGLTDLSRPTAVIIADWTRFARARPDRWDSILAVLAERTRIDPPFAVVLA
jgi:RNAse (barnase) inhibitor barstar